MERSRRERRRALERDGRPTARDAALRLLRRRPRTAAELRMELQRRGYEAGEIEETLSALEVSGYVNDAELARHYITTRAARLGHGRERLVAELERRGVSRAQAEQAWSEAVDSGELAPREQLRDAVRRQVQRLRTLDSNGYLRVYNALLRAGYDAEEIRRELPGDPFDRLIDDETHDDLP